MPIIGFTNGCFDAFHAGHIYFLDQCAMRCTSLIVAVNSDASVTALKGKGRPVDGVEVRLENVYSANAVIEHVLVFDGGDEELRWLVAKLKPDIIFKGGDYTMEKVVGADLVSRTCLIPRLEGYSTSEVVATMEPQP